MKFIPTVVKIDGCLPRVFFLLPEKLMDLEKSQASTHKPFVSPTHNQQQLSKVNTSWEVAFDNHLLPQLKQDSTSKAVSRGGRLMYFQEQGN